MTAFKVHDLNTAPAAARPLLEATEKAWGFIPQLHRTLAESPVALQAYDALSGLVGRSSLSPVEQQTVYLTVSGIHGCGYCMAGHSYLAHEAKMDEATLQALRGDRPVGDPRLEALHAFAKAMVIDRGRVPPAVAERFFAAGFTRAQALEVVVIVATKTISNYTNHLAQTPKESFMADPALAWVPPTPSAA